MAIILPTQWSGNSAYNVGTPVDFQGSLYECIIAVAASPSEDNPIPVANPNWKLTGILEVRSFYSLQDSIKIALNTDDEMINNSIPLFIQAAELSIGKVLRSPAQVITRLFETDEGGVFAIPEDILEIVHMRRNMTGQGFDLISRGNTTIEASVDRQEYQEVRDNYQSNFRTSYLQGQVDWPVYWDDGANFNIAPVMPTTEIQLTYYADVPMLGSYALVVNSNYEAINEEGMTLEEWIAEGNPADTFVQKQELILSNLWTATTPQLIRLAALVQAETYLEDQSMIPVWKVEYQKVLAETIDNFTSFSDKRQRSQTMSISYFR